MKRQESKYAILCFPRSGPVFYDGESYGASLSISDNCNNTDKSFIRNDGTGGYDYHPEYRGSLFVHTNDPDKENYFYVYDYEVFTRY